MGGERVQMVRCLLHQHEDPNDPQHTHIKLRIMLHTCNPGTGVLRQEHSQDLLVSQSSRISEVQTSERVSSENKVGGV